jgi:hypothetical protein
MTYDLAAIERAAKAATPGPWIADGGEKVEGAARSFMHDICYPCDPPLHDTKHSTRSNGAYIAQMSPDCVLALVAALRALVQKAALMHGGYSDEDRIARVLAEHGLTDSAREPQP